MQSKHIGGRGRVEIVAACAIVAWLAGAVTLSAQFGPNRDQDDAKTEDQADEKKTPQAPAFPDPPGAKKLSPRYPVWLDPKEKTVIVDGRICLTKGMLEMFACTKNTKEHEAIVSADTKAYLVHAGLLSLGAETGHPAKFQPTYQPPTGTEIEVQIHWKDDKGKMQTARAQDWIKDIRTKKAMTYPFVFAGSSVWTDPENGKKFYQAEGGDFVCVSNFSTAMLDIPVRSSKSNEELEFEVFTEKVPPLGAPVRLVFKPKLEKKDAKDGKTEGGAGKAEDKAKDAAAAPKAESK
jgi:hypothetical protein